MLTVRDNNWLPLLKGITSQFHCVSSPFNINCIGLLSFLIDGSRTLLVAGTRSSGKTSLLGSLMLFGFVKHGMTLLILS